jgi:hypothetical protein
MLAACFSHAASAAVENRTRAHRIRARRWDSLNVNGILLRSLYSSALGQKKSRQLQVFALRWRPG